MTPISADNVLSNLQWRFATKKFDPTRKIPEATWKNIENAMRLAPSSYGLQPWRFFVVTNPEVRTKLRAVSWNQPQITDASHLVVFCAKININAADVDEYVADVAAQRSVSVETLKDFRNMMASSVANPATLPGGDMKTYTRSQTYISLGFFLYTCAMLGVDACPMEGFEPQKYDEILKTSSQGYTPVVLGAAGYRAADDWLASLKKVRADASKSVVHVK